MKPILLLLFAATAACVGALLPLISRARSKRLLLNAVRRASSDAPDGIGISVLCSGVTDAAQIENLLSPEYSRYEVIVVLDARRHAAEFAALTARYRMIRVEYVLSEELPVTGVRALGRSRKRRFRRLVLVDRAQDTPAGDFDAAAEVAAYDYVLPVREGQFLLPDAVARLVAEVGERGVGGCDCVRSRIGEPAALLSREAVIAAGGFAHRPGKSVPWRRRRNLWEPVFYAPQSGRKPCRGRQSVLRVVAAASLGGAIAAAVWTGRWPVAAVLLTAALVWCVAGCVSLALSDIAYGRTGGGEKGLRRRCKIGVKNFTIS